MSKGMKYGILGVVVLALVGVIAVTAAKKKNQPTDVRIEAVQKRDLVASVTASGQVRRTPRPTSPPTSPDAS